MDNRIWYVYQNQKQMGPFDDEQIGQLFNNTMISGDAYLFKVGWKDWRPIEECMEELGLSPQGPVDLSSEAIERRRKQAPRASITGRVDCHNNAQFTAATGVNISVSGIFIETKDQIFRMGEKLKLTVRCQGLAEPFNVTAEVIRFNVDDRYPIGYGLKFEGLEPRIKSEIQVLIDAAGDQRAVVSE